LTIKKRKKVSEYLQFAFIVDFYSSKKNYIIEISMQSVTSHKNNIPNKIILLTNTSFLQMFVKQIQDTECASKVQQAEVSSFI